MHSGCSCLGGGSAFMAARLSVCQGSVWSHLPRSSSELNPDPTQVSAGSLSIQKWGSAPAPGGKCWLVYVNHVILFSWVVIGRLMGMKTVMASEGWGAGQWEGWGSFLVLENRCWGEKKDAWMGGRWMDCWRHDKTSVQFSSVAQSCPALCHPMDRSTPGFPVHHQLPELAQTHVHQVGDAIQLSHPLSSPSPPAFNLSYHQSLFQWVSSSHQVAKVLEFQLQHHSFQWISKTNFL